MLIVPDNIDVSMSKAEKHARSVSDNDTPDDPPPSYDNDSSSYDDRPSSSRPDLDIPVDIQPTNFVYVNQPNVSVRGTYVIDLSIQISQSLLPPFGENETEHKNISLRSDNGNVTGRIHLVGESQRAHLQVFAGNGSAEVAVLRTSPANRAFRLDAHSDNGHVRIYIPRDYKGPMSITHGNGFVTLSAAVKASVTSFNKVDENAKYFIGDMRVWKETGWDGDEIVAGSKNGIIKVCYSDEIVPPTASWWTKMLSKFEVEAPV